MVFFTVVIPLYNKKPHVRRAVDSVLRQSFADFELLIVDDASTDGSVDELRDISDSRMRILHRDCPGPGGYAARNLGISVAKANWIAFLDADDEWSPVHLEKMADLCKLFPSAGFLSSGWYNSYPDGQKRADSYYSQNVSRGPHVVSVADYLENSIQNRRPVYTSVTIMAKRYAVGIFPEGKVKRGGDLYAFFDLVTRVEMVWSSHIGATYFRDTVNMVTRLSPGSSLLADLLFDTVKGRVAASDLPKLKRYRNRLLWGSFVTCRSVSGETFPLASRFFWRDDFWFCLSRSAFAIILRLLPTGATARLRRIKASIKRL